MRVIAGRWRGRRLRSPQGDAVRPTSDRVKEALFSILSPQLPGALCVDLCCGAGGLGIEALSRGAAKCIFVDRSPEVLRLARANLETCRATAGTYDLVRADAGTWLSAWRPPADDAWLLLADPPYRAGLAEAIMTEVERKAAATRCLAAAVEHPVGGDAPRSAGFPAWRFRAYGGTGLAIFRPDDAPF